MKHQVSIYVKCPYYRCEEKTEIFCENLIDNTNLRLKFATKPDFKKHKKGCCMGDYNSCFLAATLNSKWAEQEESRIK